MQREIKFRGLRVDNGDLVYGYYVYTKGDNKHWIIKLGEYKREVLSESVGQYTGLHDKNGKEIYEGNLITIDQEDEEDVFVIKWDDDTARFVMECTSYTCDFDNYSGPECEIIGNIFDNQGILQEGSNENSSTEN